MGTQGAVWAGYQESIVWAHKGQCGLVAWVPGVSNLQSAGYVNCYFLLEN